MAASCANVAPLDVVVDGDCVLLSPTHLSMAAELLLLCATAKAVAAGGSGPTKSSDVEHDDEVDVLTLSTRHPIRAGHQRPIPHSQADRVLQH